MSDPDKPFTNAQFEQAINDLFVFSHQRATWSGARCPTPGGNPAILDKVRSVGYKRVDPSGIRSVAT